MTDLLSVNIAGMMMQKPVALASGILGYSTPIFQEMENSGAGAVVTKSVGVSPRIGYANPTIVQANGGVINAMGLPNPGINLFVEEVMHAKSVLTIPVIVSIYGYSSDEYSLVAQKSSKAGCDAIELNVSCPHVQYTGSEIGQNASLLKDVITKVKNVTTKPVIVKLSPNVTDIVEIAEVASKAGADAITLINTVRALAIDIETKKPILTNIRGGLSGPAIKPIALRCIYDVAENLKIPIIGCGGISDWCDAVQFLLAGASAIQIGTAIAFQDYKIFQSINKGISNYLKKKGYRSVNDIVGLAHRN